MCNVDNENVIIFMGILLWYILYILCQENLNKLFIDQR